MSTFVSGILDSISKKYNGYYPALNKDLVCNCDALAKVKYVNGSKLSNEDNCELLMANAALAQMGTYDWPIPRLLKLQDVFNKVKPAYEMVAKLNALPHETLHSCGVDYNYSATMWNADVLPLIGNTDTYVDRIVQAVNAYMGFVTNELGLEVVHNNEDFDCKAIVNLESIPDNVASTFVSLTLMAGKIQEWHKAALCQDGHTTPSINCIGDKCDDDNTSSRFFNPLTTLDASSLCYVTATNVELNCPTL